MKLGFTVDAADPVAKMDDEVRAAYAKLCEAFTAGSPGIRQLRSDFIAKVYAYGKKAGRDHPLARVMDSAAPTDDAATGDANGKAAAESRNLERSVASLTRALMADDPRVAMAFFNQVHAAVQRLGDLMT
jgi:hypothetical protein